jgi:hypothetical protein
VEVILGHRVTETIPVKTEDGSPLFKLTLSDGTEMKAGSVTSAMSRSIPSTTYLPQAALDSEGYVKIDPTYAVSPILYNSQLTTHSMNFTIDVPNSRHHFAIGDIAA